MSVHVLYAAKATATGGRDGRATIADGSLDITLTTPTELGGSGGPGNNPEQLFAAAYAACFLGALRFVASQGGPKVPDDAQVTATVGIEGLTIAVRDHGPGIAVADLPRLFDRFHRGEATRAHTSGTGMGLAIARGLLAAEHGRIWGENCAGGGALFTIVVPAESKALP